ncbi:hypothetical protein QBC34DRAFT_313554, partial [Podospora aff. communis PSN243]
CRYKATESVRTFQTSNYSRYIRLKHPGIAYDEKLEESRQKKFSVVISLESEFFRPNLAKRSRTSTVSDFSKEKGSSKVLTFVIENNISFNALDSEFFSRFSPILH